MSWLEMKEINWLLGWNGKGLFDLNSNLALLALWLIMALTILAF